MKTKLSISQFSKLPFFLLILLILSKNAPAQHVEVIGISNPVTIEGHTVPAFVSGISNIRLTRLDAEFTVNGSEIGSTGYYKFDFSSLSNYEGYYKLYVSDVEKPEYGVIQIATFIDREGTISMTGNLNMGSNRIVSLANPTADGDAVNRVYLTTNHYTKAQSDARYPQFSFLTTNHYTKSESDARYPQLDVNNTLTGDNTLSGVTSFTGAVATNSPVTFNIGVIPTPANYPKIDNYIVPPSQNSLSTKKYTDDAINTAIVKLGEGYVESPNLIWLAPDIGVTGSDYIAPTFGGLNQAIENKSPSANNRINTIIKGMGTDNENGYLIVEVGGYQGATQFFKNFTTYTGASSGIKLYIPDDGFSTATLGNIIVSNVTITRLGDESSPVFTRFVFQDCKFEMDHNSISFIDCEFRGTNIFKMGAGPITFNNCTGSTVTTNKIPVRTGTNLINYQTSISGLEGSFNVAGNTLTVIGNYVEYESDTRIDFISGEGWATGDIITIYSTAGAQFSHNEESQTQPDVRLLLANSDNLIPGGNVIIQFILDEKHSAWIEISRSEF